MNILFVLIGLLSKKKFFWVSCDEVFAIEESRNQRSEYLTQSMS